MVNTTIDTQPSQESQTGDGKPTAFYIHSAVIHSAVIARIRAAGIRITGNPAYIDALLGISPQRADRQVVAEPAFKAEHYRIHNLIEPCTLRKARERGRIMGEKRGGTWFYSEADVRRLWPEAFPIT